MTLIFLCSIRIYSQIDERPRTYISGNAGITNNGISFVPNFSLEQPATVFNLILKKGRFSFEPELTFSLEEGRAWYQVYWLRYHIVDEEKFQLRTGGHLGLNFAKILDSQNNNVIQTERYLVGELAPSYKFTDKIRVGVQYMIAKGYDIDTDELQHFITLHANFNKINIAKTLFLEVSPQIFYLSSFGFGEGYYVASGFTLSKSNFPLSLSSLMNKNILTNIPGKDFLWNLTLSYSFKGGVISKS